MSQIDSRKVRADWFFAISITILFLFYAGFTTLCHEMWRDELGSWLLSRDSASPLAIIRNSRYEGHPSLWFLLLWPLTRFTDNPVVMQGLNLLLASGAVLLIAKAAPAPRWLRAAAAFGYFPVYEYGSIARNYAIGLLGVVAFCAVFKRRRERPILLGILLFLTANTSLPACLLAIAALLALVAEAIASPLEQPGRTAVWFGFSIAAVGIALSSLQMYPPSDGGYATGWNFSLNFTALKQALNTLPKAYLPLPTPGPHFWESGLLESLPGYSRLAWIGGILLLLTTTLALIRRPVALAYYLIGSLGLLIFFYVKYTGYLRHHGFLFVCLGTALWLARTMHPITLRRTFDAAGRWAEHAILVLFPILLSIHIVSGVIAAESEYTNIFSGAKEIAALIRERGLDRLPIVGDRDFTVMTVVGYLDKERAYYPAGGRFGSYVIWDTARKFRKNVWDEAARLSMELGSPVLLVIDNHVLRARPPPPELGPALQLVGSSSGHIRTDESYSVFLYGGRSLYP